MAGPSVTLTAIPRIPLIQAGDDLANILVGAIEAARLSLQNQDVLVLAQKIVSKAEGRYVDLAEIRPSMRARELAAAVDKDPRFVEVVLSESTEVVRYRKDVLIVAHRLGFVMANAGVDQSNIEHPDGKERVLLLPRDPDASCAALKARLDAHFHAQVGVIINDSFGRAWRNGVVGVALGAAGLPAILDMVGVPDLFGRNLRVTQVALADEIAAAASLVMGQAGEGLPAVLVRGLNWKAPASTAAALLRPKQLDLFR
ncbi:MAG TPA: coenzyme F420-0:L-glutamate ligase [Alphaproteobacteria bacterium]|nr:coenzyme F420-0:L-glutamate ligase [Alphaproteobacteria bacterium]